MLKFEVNFDNNFVASRLKFVCKIPLLARRTRPRPRPSARATIGYLVYKIKIISVYRNKLKRGPKTYNNGGYPKKKQ